MLAVDCSYQQLVNAKSVFDVVKSKVVFFEKATDPPQFKMLMVTDGYPIALCDTAEVKPANFAVDFPDAVPVLGISI